MISTCWWSDYTAWQAHCIPFAFNFNIKFIFQHLLPSSHSVDSSLGIRCNCTVLGPIDVMLCTCLFCHGSVILATATANTTVTNTSTHSPDYYKVIEGEGLPHPGGRHGRRGNIIIFFQSESLFWHLRLFYRRQHLILFLFSFPSLIITYLICNVS